MNHYTKYEFDNRDTGQMYEYMEARIEALKRRILQLEHENQTMRWADDAAHNASMKNNQVSA
jgi:hypothetical protein